MKRLWQSYKIPDLVLLFFPFANRREDLKNETSAPKLFLLIHVSVSNGSGFLISSENVLMSVFVLPVHLAYLNTLLPQTYDVVAVLQLWCIFVKCSPIIFAAGLSLSAFYSIAKLWLKHSSRMWINQLWGSGECELCHLNPLPASFYWHWWHNVKYTLAGKGRLQCFSKMEKRVSCFPLTLQLENIWGKSDQSLLFSKLLMATSSRHSSDL